LTDTFVDTNVFVYAVDTDEPEKRATAIALLYELKGADRDQRSGAQRVLRHRDA
jgi:predicted nucleic acid-binding protein